MKKFIKLLAVALAAAALAGCSLVSINTEKITVATVGDETITKAALDEAFNAFLAQYGYTQDSTEIADQLPDLKEQYINMMVQNLVIEQKIEELGLGEVTDEEKTAAEQSVQDWYDEQFAQLVETYSADETVEDPEAGIDPKDIFVVSIMPCTAKKFEVTRDHQNAAGVPDVDVSLTTRELASMIRRAGIEFTQLEDEVADPVFGVASGAGHIFGATGGVMEAALRTVAEIVTGKPLESVDFKEVRGIEGIKEAEYDLAGTKVRVAVTSGLENATKLLDRIRSGEADYQFVEVMACPGGCVNGGGQPHQPGQVRNFVDLRAERAKALYSEDAGMTLRKSHENPVVKELYDTYLGEPGSEKAHHLLHTQYVARGIYKK